MVVSFVYYESGISDFRAERIKYAQKRVSYSYTVYFEGVYLNTPFVDLF